MKILFLSEFFHPHWTGLSKSILKTALRLQEKGHTCDVLTTQHDPNLAFFEKYKNISIYRSSPLLTISRTKYSLNAIFKFLRLAKNYDLIFINTPNSNTFFYAAIAKLIRKKTLLFLQGDLILPKGFMNRIVEKVFDFSMFASCALADVVSTYTEDYGENSRVLKNFVYKLHPLFLPVHSYEKKIDETCDKRMKEIRKNGTHLVGFAGRFVEEKGFDVLLKAIPKIIAKLDNVHFVFAGDQPKYEKFYDKNKEMWIANEKYLTNLGLLSEPEMNAFYKNLDLFVLCSRSDCLANTQIEAMEHKVPVVVTNIPGARWPVRTTGFGIITKPGNENALAEDIVRALINKDKLMQNYPKTEKLLDGKLFFEQFEKILK